MPVALSTIVLLAQTTLGFTGHHKAAAVVCCDTCGVRSSEVAGLIVQLQTCPNWRVRDDAAHDLRKYDWRCHPEVASALVVALLNDCEEHVRTEAAQSLKKLKPCLPGVHMALARAADCDPNRRTRRWARWALKAIGDRCEGPCGACTPGALVVGVTPQAPILAPRGPGAVMVEPPFLPEPGMVVPGGALPEGVPVSPPAVVVPPEEMPILPPSEVPIASPDDSPFLTPPSASRDHTLTEYRPGSDVSPSRDRAEEAPSELAREEGRRGPRLFQIGRRLIPIGADR